MSKSFLDWLQSWTAPAEAEQEAMKGPQLGDAITDRKQLENFLETHTQCSWCMAYVKNEIWANRIDPAWIMLDDRSTLDYNIVCPTCEQQSHLYAVNPNGPIAMCGKVGDVMPILNFDAVVILNTVVSGNMLGQGLKRARDN